MEAQGFLLPSLGMILNFTEPMAELGNHQIIFESYVKKRCHSGCKIFIHMLFL